jgi:nucleotide-binding universal stress UspA family protein
MSAGRPVLIVPPLDGQNVSFAKTVIGWNASRESCRATFDSLPILKNASDVHLTWVNPEKSLGKVGKLPGTELGAALARHDVTVTTKGLSNRSKPGVALLSYVKEQNAGLLVMGAYGHSRIRERILGGATEYVLKNTNTPVLMSN